MVSKAIGKSFGIAKSSDVVMVRLRVTPAGGFWASTEVLLNSLNNIIAEVYCRGLQGKAVVNLFPSVSNSCDLAKKTEGVPDLCSVYPFYRV